MKILKVLVPCLLFLSTSSALSQKFIDMTKKLSNIEGNLVIDGNSIRKKLNTREEVIIRAQNMVFNKTSSIILNEVIVQLSGDIIIESGAKVFPKFLNSYIFCKGSESWESKNIIVKSNLKEFNLFKVKHIKKLKGNPVIFIYDFSGKKVFEGNKESTKGVKLPIGHYDLRVKGEAYLSNLLFY